MKEMVGRRGQRKRKEAKKMRRHITTEQQVKETTRLRLPRLELLFIIMTDLFTAVNMSYYYSVVYTWHPVQSIYRTIYNSSARASLFCLSLDLTDSFICIIEISRRSTNVCTVLLSVNQKLFCPHKWQQSCLLLVASQW